ncbi:MAG: hypothetical protein JO210_16705 [Acidobacteriaceae bacterium]|nr:hypothetical protein [Acidobacteriaceae bacterium]
MTPQSSFMVLAPVNPGREAELRELLSSMNCQPGTANPLNSVVPFGQLERLHFARFVILADQTLDDIAVYGLPRVDYPSYLVFLGEVDGPAEAFFAQTVERAGDGLRRIFSHCEGFAPDVDLLAWTKARNVSPAAMYVNWIGRTVLQVREEAALRQSMEKFIQANSASLRAMQPREIHRTLNNFVTGEQQSGRITLSPAETTPLGWRIRNFLHLIGVPLILLICLPFLLVYLPFFAIQLRRRERSDPEIAPRIDPVHADLLATLEDHDVTNQFSALGSLKPGLFRRCTMRFLLWIVNYGARHVFNRGRLARVTTIHFARWVFLDGKKRVLFASNYDGSLESYMDDFINKVAFGLNLVFSNGIGYPRTRWLILDGAKDEQKFKYFLRRHELPTEVWYNAHPGLTALDKKRNSMIREGLERSSMTDTEIQEWLRLL